MIAKKTVQDNILNVPPKRGFIQVFKVNDSEQQANSIFLSSLFFENYQSQSKFLQKKLKKTVLLSSEHLTSSKHFLSKNIHNLKKEIVGWSKKINTLDMNLEIAPKGVHLKPHKERWRTIAQLQTKNFSA